MIDIYEHIPGCLKKKLTYRAFSHHPYLSFIMASRVFLASKAYPGKTITTPKSRPPAMDEVLAPWQNWVITHNAVPCKEEITIIIKWKLYLLLHCSQANNYIKMEVSDILCVWGTPTWQKRRNYTDFTT